MKKPKIEEESVEPVLPAPLEEVVAPVEPVVEKPALVPEVVVEAEPKVEEKAVPTEPVAEVKEEKKESGGWLLILVAFVLGLLVGAMTMYLIKAQSPKPKAQDVVVSGMPSPSPLVEVKRADLKVQVLNGSGVAGAAAKAKDYLEGLGYTGVAVGNADGNVETTTIAVKADKKDVFDLVRKDLESKYTVDAGGGELAGSSDYDVVVTLGPESAK